MNSPQRGAAIFQEALTSAAASDIYDLVQKSVDEVPSKDATVARGAARAGRSSSRGCLSLGREASATREAKEFLVDYRGWRLSADGAQPASGEPRHPTPTCHEPLQYSPRGNWRSPPEHGAGL